MDPSHRRRRPDIATLVGLVSLVLMVLAGTLAAAFWATTSPSFWATTSPPPPLPAWASQPEFRRMTAQTELQWWCQHGCNWGVDSPYCAAAHKACAQLGTR